MPMDRLIPWDRLAESRDELLQREGAAEPSLAERMEAAAVEAQFRATHAVHVLGRLESDLAQLLAFTPDAFTSPIVRACAEQSLVTARESLDFITPIHVVMCVCSRCKARKGKATA